MKNSIYNIEFNKLDGTVLSLKLAHDADNFCERFIFKNLVYADLFLNEHNCSIEVPFKDLYT